MPESAKKEYDVRICKCGRIHFLDWDKIKKAIDNNRVYGYICGGCGTIRAIGADKFYDEYEGKECYDMFSYDFEEETISTSNFFDNNGNRPFDEFCYSKGIRVPMNTGSYARAQFNNQFTDIWYPDFHSVLKKSSTKEEIVEFINKFLKDANTVNMNRLIAEIGDDDKCEVLSHYAIKAFNWKGTKWETEYNSHTPEEK